MRIGEGGLKFPCQTNEHILRKYESIQASTKFESIHMYVLLITFIAVKKMGKGSRI